MKAPQPGFDKLPKSKNSKRVRKKSEKENATSSNVYNNVLNDISCIFLPEPILPEEQSTDAVKKSNPGLCTGEIIKGDTFNSSSYHGYPESQGSLNALAEVSMRIWEDCFNSKCDRTLVESREGHNDNEMELMKIENKSDDSSCDLGDEKYTLNSKGNAQVRVLKHHIYNLLHCRGG